MTVTAQDRYKKAHPCPICGGSEDFPKHHKRRCTGFVSNDGEWARCSRDELAGNALLDDKCNPPVYIHKLHGECKCGDTHGVDTRERWPDPVAEYEYRDERGELVAKKIRFPKSHHVPFIWKHRDGGEWKNGRKGQPPPYNLPDLISHEGTSPVYIVEGEKDVETLKAKGLTAITNPDGAGRGKWAHVSELAAPYLAGLDVVVIADADDKGRPHAREAYELFKTAAGSIRVLECTKGKDITDHLQAGGTLDELVPIKADHETNGHTNGFRPGVSFEDAEPPPGFFEDDEPSGVREKPKKEEPPRIQWIEADLIAAPLPDLSYMVRGLQIPAESAPPHAFAAYGFSGKSVAAQDALLSTATGRPWWGAYDCKKGKAAFISGEQGERVDRRRFQRLARGRGIDLRELQGWLRLGSMPALRFTHKGAEDDLCRELDGINLAVFDSFRWFCPGVDENESKIRQYLDMLHEVSKKTGCSIFVTLHARKKQKGDPPTCKFMIRGSSSIFDALDTAFVFAAEKGEPTEVSNIKSRSHGSNLEEDFCISIQDVPDPKNPLDARWGLKLQVQGHEALRELREKREQQSRNAAAARIGPEILHAIGQQDFTDCEGLAKHLSRDVKAVRAAVNAFIESGVLMPKKRGEAYRLGPNAR